MFGKKKETQTPVKYDVGFFRNLPKAQAPPQKISLEEIRFFVNEVNANPMVPPIIKEGVALMYERILKAESEKTFKPGPFD